VATLDASAQAAMFAGRLRKNQRRLRDWARGAGVTCYRVYDGDIPEVPVTVDDYEGRLVVADVRRPGGELEAQGDAWIDAMAVAAQDALAARAVHVKRREKMIGRRESGRQYGRVGDDGSWLEVGEGGHRFLVNLSDYLDTGLFLDHRITRAMAASEAAGKRVLNLFCYTGAFSVYCAAAGATASTSVDLSSTYLDWAGENLARNHVSTDAHRLVKSDVKRFLDDARLAGERWDLAIVDPPTFSNSKAMDYVWDVQRDHAALLAAVAAVRAPGGVVWFSTNRRRFTLEASLAGEVGDLTAETSPPDFRDRPHRTYRFALPDRRAPSAGPSRSPAPALPRGPRTPPGRRG
jgi:23S rRNA G2069 N7-methylase RlmK/C1962 C5-methylase RlmI